MSRIMPVSNYMNSHNQSDPMLSHARNSKQETTTKGILESGWRATRMHCVSSDKNFVTFWKLKLSLHIVQACMEHSYWLAMMKIVRSFKVSAKLVNLVLMMKLSLQKLKITSPWNVHLGVGVKLNPDTPRCIGSSSCYNPCLGYH
jgi:hypothetical protein